MHPTWLPQALEAIATLPPRPLAAWGVTSHRLGTARAQPVGGVEVAGSGIFPVPALIYRHKSAPNLLMLCAVVPFRKKHAHRITKRLHERHRLDLSENPLPHGGLA